MGCHIACTVGGARCLLRRNAGQTDRWRRSTRYANAFWQASSCRVLRLVADEALAEDLLSEVFLAVWQEAASFERRSSVSTWLLSMARHKALSARQRAVDVELNEDAVAKPSDTEDDPGRVLQNTDRAEALRHALPRLSPQHSEVIDLVYYHGKSVKEVAEIVGDGEATVKTRMFNARRQLAELAELCTYALALKSRLAPTAYNGNHRTSPGVRG
jgi:RNA polymerase sigma-70 factor, ECF subfamily